MSDCLRLPACMMEGQGHGLVEQGPLYDYGAVVRHGSFNARMPGLLRQERAQPQSSFVNNGALTSRRQAARYMAAKRVAPSRIISSSLAVPLSRICGI